MTTSDKRILLLVSITTYRVGDFLAAAERLEMEVCVGSNQRHILEAISYGGTMSVDFKDIELGCQQIVAYHNKYPISAIIGVDEETTLLAATASKKLGLRGNDPLAVEATCNKFLFRNRMANSGLPAPYHTLINVADDPGKFCENLNFPVVMKPLSLSASRGVIRVNTPQEFIEGFHRICAILSNPDNKIENNKEILVEDYIHGIEVAVEGILSDGKLQVIAIFDKPDPLQGPYFEETIYITPSRLSADYQYSVHACVQKSAGHLGLSEGPVHAELRINGDGIWLIEVAARSIGGNCARSLHAGIGGPLEDQILRQALGMKPVATNIDRTFSTPFIPQDEQEAELATGVMMIPIPHAGKLRSVSGLEPAKAVTHVTEVTINIAMGQVLVPLPEGNKYLGFIFAEAPTPEIVEHSLREAHAALEFEIDE